MEGTQLSLRVAVISNFLKIILIANVVRSVEKSVLLFINNLRFKYLFMSLPVFNNATNSDNDLIFTVCNLLSTSTRTCMFLLLYSRVIFTPKYSKKKL